MTHADFDTYKLLSEAFNQRCKDICNELKIVDKRFSSVDSFELKNGNVICSGEEYLIGHGLCHFERIFPEKLICATEKELEDYIFELWLKHEK